MASTYHTGIQAGPRASVRNCSVTDAFSGAGGPGVGIDLLERGEAIGCSARVCLVGVRSGVGGRVIDCTADGCSAACVRLTASGNTVENCRLHNSAVGVDMTGVGGNLAVRNILMNNTTGAINAAANTIPFVTLPNVGSSGIPLANVLG